MSSPIAPDPKAGKELLSSLGGESIEIDTDELRSLSTTLGGYADTFEALAKHTDTIGETVKSEAAAFTRDNSPAPIYADTVSGLEHTGDKYKQELTKLAEQLRSDAAALIWIADQSETGESENAAAISGIDGEVYSI